METKVEMKKKMKRGTKNCSPVGGRKRYSTVYLVKLYLSLFYAEKAFYLSCCEQRLGRRARFLHSTFYYPLVVPAIKPRVHSSSSGYGKIISFPYSIYSYLSSTIRISDRLAFSIASDDGLYQDQGNLKGNWFPVCHIPYLLMTLISEVNGWC